MYIYVYTCVCKHMHIWCHWMAYGERKKKEEKADRESKKQSADLSESD